MIGTFFNFSLVILSWSINSFIQKDFTKYVNNTQSTVIFHFSYQIVLYLLVLYVVLFDRKQIENFKSNLLNMPLSLYFGLLLMACLMIWTATSQYELYKIYDVNHILPIVRGASNVLIIIIGYYCYNESITFKKLIAIILIIGGIYIINSNATFSTNSPKNIILKEL